jgi:hypothetical protein
VAQRFFKRYPISTDAVVPISLATDTLQSRNALGVADIIFRQGERFVNRFFSNFSDFINFY